MSATITTNYSIESSIKDMCLDVAQQSTENTIKALYNEGISKFQTAEEAIEFIKNIGKPDIKFTKTRLPVAKSEKKSKKSKEDKPKVKKAKSGYLLHNDAERSTIKAQLEKEAEESGVTLKSTDIITALGAHWKALSDDEKKNWNDKSALLKEEDIVDDSESDVKEEVKKEVKEEVKKEVKKVKKVKEEEGDEQTKESEE